MVNISWYLKSKQVITHGYLVYEDLAIVHVLLPSLEISIENNVISVNFSNTIFFKNSVNHGSIGWIISLNENIVNLISLLISDVK